MRSLQHRQLSQLCLRRQAHGQLDAGDAGCRDGNACLAEDSSEGDSFQFVKAVKKGTLYRGGISCRGGTLQYVRVDHADDEYDTYYLHVNYF